MAGQVNPVNLNNAAARAVVCKTEPKKRKIGEISKFSAKLSFNEDGTPTIIDGSYLFMKDNGTSLSLNSNLIDISIENQVVRVVADDNSVEEISLDCSGDAVLTLALDEDDEGAESSEQATPTPGGGDLWSDAPTRLLIQLYSDLLVKVKTRELRTFKVMWERASEMMADRGYAFTGCQMSNRFKTLKRAYGKRKYDLRHGRTQKGRIRPLTRRCPYERELDELFAKQAEIFPESLPRDEEEETFSRSEFFAMAGFDPSAFLEDEDDDQTHQFASVVEMADHAGYGEPPPPQSPEAPPSPSPSPRRRPRANALDELRGLRASTLERLTMMDAKRDAFHEEVLDELKHKNDMLEKLLELVTKESLS